MKKLLRIGVFLFSFIVNCKAETEQVTFPAENVGAEMEASEDKADDIYTFFVRDLDEVGLNGESAEDFYITNTGNFPDTIYYINSEKQLYRYQKKLTSDKTQTQLIAENVVHVDCGGAYFIFLTGDGMLYGMGYNRYGILLTENESVETPVLLMEDVSYALCGYADVVVLKKDGTVWTWREREDEHIDEYMDKVPTPHRVVENAVMISGRRDSHAVLLEDGTVWTWGDNAYDKCGVAGQGAVEEPVCVASDGVMIWMEKLQINDMCKNWEKMLHYGYDNGYNDNLVIKKADGSLWACGREIEDKENHMEQDGIVYTCNFVPCEIVQTPYIAYDGLKTYQSVLEEYERALKDEKYTEERWKEIDVSFAIFNHNEDHTLCYSLADLANDGIEELILGFLYDGEYRTTAIYAYDEGIVIGVWNNMERNLSLYEGGIIESVSVSAGHTYYSYYQLQKNSGLEEYLETVSDVPKNWGRGDEEELLYYRSTAVSDEEEVITEEEYNRIRNQYETTPIELEWKVLEGFWEGDND
ncbi:MAG: hypothetical protein NC429_07865 [Lachnospiraceae bacterium]|nr:hypothetical protein [Lachnospiraceae bacterium]